MQKAEGPARASAPIAASGATNLAVVNLAVVNLAVVNLAVVNLAVAAITVATRAARLVALVRLPH